MNGLPIDAPRSERRKDNDRKPMIDLDEQDRLAELELARKAQTEEKERSRAEYLAKLEASAAAPKPVKAKPPGEAKKEGDLKELSRCQKPTPKTPRSS